MTEKFEAQVRAEIVQEAVSWLRTPYHDCARLKGVGTDCLGFLYGVFRNTGLIPEIDIPHYSYQWHLHHTEEVYLQNIEKFARRVERPLPGDFVMYRFGRAYSHSAIILPPGFPSIIHAFKELGCVGYGEGDQGYFSDPQRKPIFYSVI